MELDRVRRDTGLRVVEVEERDARHASMSAEPEVLACLAHLPASVGRGAAVACGGRALRDHVIGSVLEDEVEVAVGLVPDERHRGVDAEDTPLERRPVRWQRSWLVNCPIVIAWAR